MTKQDDSGWPPSPRRALALGLLRFVAYGACLSALSAWMLKDDPAQILPIAALLSATSFLAQRPATHRIIRGLARTGIVLANLPWIGLSLLGVILYSAVMPVMCGLLVLGLAAWAIARVWARGRLPIPFALPLGLWMAGATWLGLQLREGVLCSDLARLAHEPNVELLQTGAPPTSCPSGGWIRPAWIPTALWAPPTVRGRYGRSNNYQEAMRPARSVSRWASVVVASGQPHPTLPLTSSPTPPPPSPAVLPTADRADPPRRPRP